MERGHEVSSTFNDPFLRSRIIINPGGGGEVKGQMYKDKLQYYYCCTIN